MKSILAALGRRILGEEGYLQTRRGKRKTARRVQRRASRRIGLPFRLATAPLRALPDFLIIGAQKAGTTSLYEYLIQHSHVRAPIRKEPRYFSSGRPSLPDYSLLWYRINFPLNRQMTGDGKIYRTGEASPDYLLHPLAAGRAAHFLPMGRIIILLRDPVSRAYSHYYHNHRKGKEDRSFEEAIQGEIASLENLLPRLTTSRFNETARYLYLTRGCYAPQVQRWLDHFPRSQILILPSENLFKNPQAVFTEVLDFLEIPEGNLAAINFRARRKGHYTAPMQVETRTFLKQYFRPHNERLGELLGMDFGWD